MFRTVNDQPTLWDSILPPELLVLPVELGRVDALLEDPVFFGPFAAYFDARIGRPSIPMETYLRLMFLKFRYRLGYESLCREVSDSISWQRFCRIPFGTRVPHPTTLMKITTRCGENAVAGLNEALLAKAAAAKLLRTDKVRADTTVVEAAVAYPTDSGLLAKAIGSMARTVARIKAAGGATRTRSRDRRRSAGKRARSIAAKLKLRGEQQRDAAQSPLQSLREGVLFMSESFRLDQPRANDLVGNPLLIAGSGGGFEATIAVRVLDGNGQVLVETSVTSTNLTSAWQTSVSLPEPPPTNRGVVQVGPSTGADEAPPRVSVPVFYGTAIAPGFRSYFLYTVQPGDTLSGIAVSQAPLYIGSGFAPIFEANRHIIGDDPDLIHPGTVLRLPSDF